LKNIKEQDTNKIVDEVWPYKDKTQNKKNRQYLICDCYQDTLFKYGLRVTNWLEHIPKLVLTHQSTISLYIQFGVVKTLKRYKKKCLLHNILKIITKQKVSA